MVQDMLPGGLAKSLLPGTILKHPEDRLGPCISPWFADKNRGLAIDQPIQMRDASRDDARFILHGFQHDRSCRSTSVGLDEDVALCEEIVYSSCPGNRGNMFKQLQGSQFTPRRFTGWPCNLETDLDTRHLLDDLGQA